MRPNARFVKMAALAALVLAAASPGAARAETIARERLGCRTAAVNERLLAMVQADDAEGYGRLLRGSLASGECKYWKPGDEVELGNRTIGYACMTAKAGSGPCFWTPVTALEKGD
ncbi:hypothetical protein Q8W71_01835 [Methylobacterium sp. NEAU 140]|uniref:hypothetical protein n=1 Tax=Methylobacterium sp. NEAU 140 TaxID=3064945 RepID=UPI002735B344|nr:hypothetical protein [Methylobacterium sp. NEAU 140]MDP4021350.1 hypothetical protein [Methylobacterium sp. NEAU 140]